MQSVQSSVTDAIATSTGAAGMPTRTAACLVGEVRALVYPQVLAMLQRNVLSTLDADSFMVYTRTWSKWQLNESVHQKTYDLHKRVGFDRIPKEITSDQMSDILMALRPVVAEETSDEEVVTRANGSPGWLPVPLAMLAKSSLCADMHGPNPHDSTCLFALRCARCLQLVQRSERARGSPYAWVLRARPDVFVGCRWHLPTSWYHPLANASSWVAYAWDYLAFMPRSAATASLGEGFLATSRAHCIRGSTGGSIGCNACWVKRRGLNLLSLEKRDFGPVDIARQVRATLLNVSGHPSALLTLHLERSIPVGPVRLEELGE